MVQFFRQDKSAEAEARVEAPSPARKLCLGRMGGAFMAIYLSLLYSERRNLLTSTAT